MSRYFEFIKNKRLHVFSGKEPRDAALKVATRFGKKGSASVNIELHERGGRNKDGTYSLHQYKVGYKEKKTPNGAPKRLGSTVKEPLVKKVGVKRVKQLPFGTKKEERKVHEIKKQLYRGLLVDLQVGEVINFYEQTRDLAGNEKARSEKKLDGIDKSVARDEYREMQKRVDFYTRYPMYLRETTFLMLFSLIEEFLTSAYNIVTGSNIATERNGIERFKRPYSDAGISLTDIKRWEFLIKCQTIRNVLLHANGRISLHKAPQQIYAILNDAKWFPFFVKRQGLFKIKKKGKEENEHIEVKEPALNELLHSFNELQELILGSGDETKS